MCGEDGAQRGVYKLKEEHEEGGSKQKKKREKDINRKEESKSREKELHWSLNKTFVVSTLEL